MKIALIQLDIEWESKKINYRKTETFIKRASEEKCDIVVLPEMFNTGFSMNVSAIAEDEDGETALFLSEMAKEYGINVIAGFPAKSSFNGKRGKNLAVVYDRRGNLITTFTKLHPLFLQKKTSIISLVILLLICFVIGVNRIGTDGNGIHYPGASHIFDPLGNDIFSGDETEEFLVGEFNPAEVSEIRSKFPSCRIYDRK
jgi:predicted amidohydrolase